MEEEAPTTKRQILTVMFVDIRGSAKIEETLSPDLTVEFVNLYLGLAAQAILANHGEVNQFIGDGLLATFGLTDEPDRGASNAIAAAAAIHRSFGTAKLRQGLTDPVHAVVAIHTGVAIVNAIDETVTSHCVVLGAAVNVASRLEAEAKENGLATVVSGSTAAALTSGVGLLRLVTRKKLRGVSDGVEIWSPDPPESDDSFDVTAVEHDMGSPWQLDWSPVLLGLLAAAVLIATLLAIVGLRSDEKQFTTVLMNLTQPTLAIAATVTSGWRASRSGLHIRRGWMLIAASSAALAIGLAAEDMLALGVWIVSMPAWFADVSTVGSSALAIAGALSFWTSSLGRYGRWRAVLDGLIVCSSLIFVLWAAMGPSAMTDQLMFSIGEIVLATVLILVVNRGARHLQAALLLLLASVAMGGTAAVFGAYETNAPVMGVYVADVVRVLALVLFALAPLWPEHPAVAPSEDVTDVWQLTLPWMAVTAAALSAVVLVLRGEGLDRFLTVLGAAFAGLLGASQFLTQRDFLTSLYKSRQSEKALSDVIERAPIGIARVSTDFKILAANPSLSVLLRDPLEVLAGSAIVRYFPADIQPELRRRLAALASGECDILESDAPMVRADGSRAWVHFTSTPVKEPKGHYFLAMVQDTTEKHEAEQASAASLAELERLNQVKTEFLQSISHEFKTALIGIEGFSELLRDSAGVDVDEVKAFARDIHSGAVRLSNMVSEFLDLDHVETASTPLLLGPVDMNTIIRRDVEEMKLETDGLTFAAGLDPSLPVIVGDEVKLSQLVMLLLRNAVRYSPDGGRISVATRLHIGQFDFSVRDQGVGVRADFDNPLFSRDDLYARNPIRRVVGTDLGLGIARRIVALHGGRIWMHRLDGIGSEAHATFPLVMTAPLLGGNLEGVAGQAS